ncbi:MAG: chromosome segregation protein SMC [Eubacterium sp.]|nr:chromosome segregation protein SMC [Eubacterium sp.]
MYFKRIEMHGFKSFAEPVTIEFDKGITCVVGPNGSGKSNISDAIRWVLGEQSPKMLRGGKMEDVIFAGTANRKSRGMAEVTLVIDNSTGILPIEYKEVAITRRMYRSGESEYAINNNQCRMKDIRELLMDTGIGVDGYSLIGQGKISDIISNKTDSIREIFEETAGIVSYRSKKSEAERKLASANTNMDRVNDIIQEIESRIGNLKEDSEKAEEYVGLRDRYRELEINITVNNIEDIEKKSMVLSDDLAELEREMEELNKKQSDLEKEIADAKFKLDNYDGQLYDTEDKLKRATDSYNTNVNENNLNRERLKAMEKDVIRIRGEIFDLKEKLQKEEEGKEKLFADKRAIDQRHRELEAKLQEEIAAHSSTVNEKSALTEEIDNKKNDIFSLMNRKNSWIVEKNSLASMIVNLDSNEESIRNEQASGKEEHQNLIDSLEMMKNEEAAAAEKAEKLALDEKELTSQINDARADMNNMQKEHQDLGIKIGQKSARKKTIEEMESNYEGYNSGVRFVMKAGVRGIDGVVAELISVPQGYEVALETALGAMMQNVVCDSDDTAKEAIRLLKNNKAGRLTFLPVKSIKSKGVMRDESIEKENGFMGYGVDCTEFDEKYRSVIEYLLGNVVVIDNMDNAVRISKKGSKALKYVTLEGEIINTAGAVTGGKYKNKTANILERRGEIAALEKDIKEMSQAQIEIEDKRSQLRDIQEKLQERFASVSEDLRNAQIESVNAAGRRKMLEDSLKNFEDKSGRWEAALVNIQKERENASKGIGQLDEKIVAADRDMNNLQVSVEELEEKLGSMSQQIDLASESITAARINATSCEGEKENIENLLKRVEEAILQYQSDIQYKEGQMENIHLDENAIKEGIENRNKVIVESRTEKERLELYRKQIDRDKFEVSRIYAQSSEAREEASKTAAKIQGQKYDIDVKLARSEAQLDSLKNKLWEDFEVSYAQALSMKSADFAMASAVRENRQIKNRIRELGEVNVGAIKEYAQVKERYEFLTEQRADIQKSTDELNIIINNMDKIIREKFKESFDQVVEHFESTFVEFFGGGSAKIRLDKEDDPLNSNIEIIAQPPGKQLKNINLMSGGEKTMTAIALMFAVLKTKPTPCCILDEVEAALDDHNIHVFANYLKKFENIQFTLITHQKTTMEHADVMYGVTMPERGISKVFSLRMGDELPV